MQITALVVTHNRLSLLQECITGIRLQTIPPISVIVVNNSSTDGTGDWLDSQQDIITVHQPNNGGAWGFYTGIKEAYEMGADWFWVMDDDTIPQPTALEELVKAAEQLNKHEDDKFGFLASKVLWTDGNWHLMNKPLPNRNFCGKKSTEYYHQKGIVPVVYNFNFDKQRSRQESWFTDKRIFYLE